MSYLDTSKSMADDLESEITEMSNAISSAELLIENLTSKTQEDEEAMEEIMDAVKKLLDSEDSDCLPEGSSSVNTDLLEALSKVHRYHA